MKKSNAQTSQTDQRLQRSERRHMGLVVPLLLLALIMASQPIRPGHIKPTDLVWGGVLILGVGILVHSAITSYRQSDELQKHIRLQAAALSFGVTTVALFVAGLVRAFEVTMPRALLQMLFIGSVGFWSLAQVVLEKRSRR